VNEPLEVVFLAGRLGVDDDGWPLIPLLDRLERRGVLSRVLCLARGLASGADPRLIEIPALSNRWLMPLTIRRLQIDGAMEHACLLHVLHEEIAGAALALAEACQLPYLQTVDDFAVLDHGLRVSRRWFRGLVVTSPDLARDVSAGLGIPADRISVIAPGVQPGSEAPRLAGWRIPVICTAGIPRAGSGFGCFLTAARQVFDSGHDAEFLIASQGDDTGDILRHARSLRIADRVSVADFAVVGNRFWSVLDLFCQPSLVPSTGRLQVLAMAAGIPCIASRVDGLVSLLDHENSGLIVAPGDPAELAAALIQLMDHPEPALLMGRRGRQTTQKRFDLEIEADLLASLYRRHAVPPRTGAGSPS
jgi:glycosyltransferase involved in cell wall biosynthesis